MNARKFALWLTTSKLVEGSRNTILLPLKSQMIFHSYTPVTIQRP